ncbi:hypothetical protein Tam10B_1867 [Bifidobacterium vansinderenii]|uniref:Uncharacterized protein n=1 Tax=Bifidobacterium vansinderenii TaxID=1984871 RepID=A0A229VWA7_9BIFI|nr:hypothetical protein Tam10B_1867 [Bifidobacterium vansinderenii]
MNPLDTPAWLRDLAIQAMQQLHLTNQTPAEACVLGYISGWMTALDWTLNQLQGDPDDDA